MTKLFKSGFKQALHIIWCFLFCFLSSLQLQKSSHCNCFPSKFIWQRNQFCSEFLILSLEDCFFKCHLTCFSIYPFFLGSQQGCDNGNVLHLLSIMVASSPMLLLNTWNVVCVAEKLKFYFFIRFEFKQSPMASSYHIGQHRFKVVRCRFSLTRMLYR